MGYGKPVSGPPQKADLVFFSEDGSGNITHVGLATGDGDVIIHASNYANHVTKTPMGYISGYVGARRLL
jgi:cell wall-associated NlpC family hydrolase